MPASAARSDHPNRHDHRASQRLEPPRSPGRRARQAGVHRRRRDAQLRRAAPAGVPRRTSAARAGDPPRAAGAARARRHDRVPDRVPGRDADRRRPGAGEPARQGRQLRALHRRLRTPSSWPPTPPSLQRLRAAFGGRQPRYLVRGVDEDDVVELDTALAAQDDELEPAATHRDDMAFWLYSSGSTGKPKGVVHLQHDISVTCETYGEHVLGLTRDDVARSRPRSCFTPTGWATRCRSRSGSARPRC